MICLRYWLIWSDSKHIRKFDFYITALTPMLQYALFKPGILQSREHADIRRKIGDGTMKSPESRTTGKCLCVRFRSRRPRHGHSCFGESYSHSNLIGLVACRGLKSASQLLLTAVSMFGFLLIFVSCASREYPASSSISALHSATSSGSNYTIQRGNLILESPDSSDVFLTLDLNGAAVEFENSLLEIAICLAILRSDGLTDVGIAMLPGENGGRPNVPSGIAASIGGFEGGKPKSVSISVPATTVDTLSAVQTGDRVALSWREKNTGDYDNNGEVAIADITPIAVHYLHTVGTDYLDAYLDTSGNGEVGIEDITPIALNYQSAILGYNVYRDGVKVAGAGTATVLRPSPGALPSESRYPLAYSFDDAPALTETAEIEYAVRPVHAGGSAGATSNLKSLLFNVEEPPPLPPEISPPGNLQAFPESGKLTLTWNSAPEPEITGYRIYYSLDSFDDLLQSTLETDSPLPTFQLAYYFSAQKNVTVYFRMTSVAETEEWGLIESDASEIASGIVNDNTPPPVPILTMFEQVEGGLRAAWQPVVAGDLVGYRVYYSDSTFTDVTSATEGPGSPVEEEELIMDLPFEVQYFVRITAFDDGGNESAPSNILNAIRNVASWSVTQVASEGRNWFSSNRLVLTDEDIGFVAIVRESDAPAPGTYPLSILDGRSQPVVELIYPDSMDSGSGYYAIGGPGPHGYVYAYRPSSQSTLVRFVSEDLAWESSTSVPFQLYSLLDGRTDDAGNIVFPVRGDRDFAGWLVYNQDSDSFDFVEATIEGQPIEVEHTWDFHWYSDSNIVIFYEQDNGPLGLCVGNSSGAMTSVSVPRHEFSNYLQPPVGLSMADGVIRLFVKDSSNSKFCVWTETAPGSHEFTFERFDGNNKFWAPTSISITPAGWPVVVETESLNTGYIVRFNGAGFTTESIAGLSALSTWGNHKLFFDPGGVPGFLYPSTNGGLFLIKRDSPFDEWN